MLEQNTVVALGLSFGAGLSTMVGAGIIFFDKGKSNRVLSFALGLAGGVMISVGLSELLPRAIQDLGGGQRAALLAAFALALGAVAAMLIDSLVPRNPAIGGEPGTKGELLRVGLVSMVAMLLHNLPEGIASFMAGYTDWRLGLTVAGAIALHNIPEGISVALPVYHATGSRRKALGTTLLSALAEPAGALLTFWCLRPWISPQVLGLTFALVAGIMLYIALEELIPASRRYGYPRLALAAMFLGICLMPITNL